MTEDTRSGREVLQDQAEVLEETTNSRRYVHVNGWKLVILSVLTGLLIGGLFFIRAGQTASADKRICSKVDRIDSVLIQIVQKLPQDKTTREWIRLFRSAACDPGNLPSVPEH